MYLVDTNVWLERLLDQAASAEVAAFLGRVGPERLFVTDFAFHSICVVMSRLKRVDGLLQFAEDVFAAGGAGLVHLEPSDTELVARAMDQFRLDFDDAYQYVAARKHGLVIVSFDGDFDRTDAGRRTPAAASP